MSSLKLNQNNDIYFNNFGRIVFVENLNSDEEIKQKLLVKLKTFKGEWFLDSEQGIPYFFEIFGTKNSDFNIIENFLKTAILSTKGVKNLIQSDIDYEPQNRKLKYNFQAITINNTKIQLEVII